MKTEHLFVTILCLSFCSCIQTETRDADEKPDQEINQENEKIISLLGSPLPELDLSEDERKNQQEKLDKARLKYEQNPDSLNNIIAYGQSLATLGLYDESIRIYTIGLNKHPDSYQLHRYRGCHYVISRNFDKGIEDLQRAAFYVRPHETVPEPTDFTEIEKPASNNKYNVWVRLGLGYYLDGNYDKAISAFKKCLEFSNNDDLLVATTYWFYLTYRKTGNVRAAENLLASIHKKMRITDNRSYYQSLLFFKGIYSPEKIKDNATDSNGTDPILGYALGNWYLYKGKINKATALLLEVLKNKRWDTPAYIASEKDLSTISNL